MTLGLALFTLFHVAVSLVGIAAGFVVAYQFVTNQRLGRWNVLFLTATIATSVSGFGFPFTRFLPSHTLGILSLAVLAVAVYARYSRGMAGGWRPAYVVSALVAQYFNFFVLVVQSFGKIPALKALAPTQTEAPFALTQLAVLVVFVVLGVYAVRRFRGGHSAVVSQPITGHTLPAELYISGTSHQSLSS